MQLKAVTVSISCMCYCIISVDVYTLSIWVKCGLGVDRVPDLHAQPPLQVKLEWRLKKWHLDIQYVFECECVCVCVCVCVCIIMIGFAYMQGYILAQS